jgi:hypothetical protein
MSIATDQEQLAYFYQRVESIKTRKLKEKQDLIPNAHPSVTHAEVVQALIDGSATVSDKSISASDLVITSPSLTLMPFISVVPQPIVQTFPTHRYD